MPAQDHHQIEWSQLRDAVRQRPGLYVGGRGAWGVQQMICELAANSIDCFLAGAGTHLGVTLRGRKITVVDDGPGLPFDDRKAGESVSLAEKYLTSYRSTPTADGHAPHCHLVYPGVGIAVVNALSSSFSAESWRRGRIWRIRFRQGLPLGGPTEEPTPRRGSGTRFRSVPDRRLFGDHSPGTQEMRARFFEAAHLHPGLKISFNGERFLSEGGLAELALVYNGARSHWHLESRGVFSASVRQGDYMIHAAACEGFRTSEILTSWANGVHTRDGGSHVEGFLDALRWAKWTPRIVLIHVVMHDPRFAGPSKDKLINPEARVAVRTALKPLLSTFLRATT